MLVVPLELMASGEQGRVSSMDGADEFVVRLEEMGLREGTQIRMVQSGSPCILAVNEQRFSFRFDGTATVLVEVAR
jgi:ferrous iron transport protein A